MERGLVGALLLVFLHQGQNQVVMSDAPRLLTHLLENYRRVNKYLTARPVYYPNETISVDFSIHLREVRYDEETGRAEFVLVEEQSWSDILLQWNPEDFGGVESLYAPARNVWTPDIMVLNRASFASDVDPNTNLRISYNGAVVYAPLSIRVVTCGEDGNDPNIVHCDLKYGSRTYPTTKINLTTKQDELGDSNPNPYSQKTQVVDSSVSTGVTHREGFQDSYTVTTYNVQLRRNMKNRAGRNGVTAVNDGGQQSVWLLPAMLVLHIANC